MYYSQSDVTPTGYAFERIAGYVYNSSGSGRVAIYQFFDATNVNHFYRADSEVPDGYTANGIAYYLLNNSPSPTTNPSVSTKNPSVTPTTYPTYNPSQIPTLNPTIQITFDIFSSLESNFLKGCSK